MVKALLSLFVVCGLSACEPAPPPTAADVARYETERRVEAGDALLRRVYVRDPRTGLCFLANQTVYGFYVFSVVPCTPLVIAEVTGGAAE